MIMETVYDNLNMDNAQLLAMQTHTTEKINTVNTDQSTKSPATPNSPILLLQTRHTVNELGFR